MLLTDALFINSTKFWNRINAVFTHISQTEKKHLMQNETKVETDPETIQNLLFLKFHSILMLYLTTF